MTEASTEGPAPASNTRAETLVVIAVLVVSAIFAPLIGLLVPLVLVAVGVALRQGGRHPRVGRYLLWAGTVLAAITALAAYGIDGHAKGSLASSAAAPALAQDATP